MIKKTKIGLEVKRPKEIYQYPFRKKKQEKFAQPIGCLYICNQLVYYLNK